MLTSLFFILFCFLVITSILSFRFFINRQEIDNLQQILLAGNKIEKEDKLADAKNLTFAFFDDMQMILSRQLKFVFHWVLHIFVIVLGIVSDITDKLYFFARDIFLQTATKEREVVAKFWPHLKEYKREKEEEKNNL